MAQGTLKIHTENILPIIKKWLYSDKDIFVRELVSNACDAIRKLQILQVPGEYKIDITLDKEARTLTFSDTGIGMTAEEVEKYIAQVAFSGAEEFIHKYQSHEEIIGHFGLGFYSSFMVSDKVTIDSLSYQENAAPAFWSCDGSSSYTLDTGTRTSRGTAITLHLNSDEFLEEGRLREILNRYCAFLPYPITLNGAPINEKEPLFQKPASSCTDADYLEFYRALYPMEPDPIFWIHLSIDYPFHLKGILYFPKLNKRLDWSKANIKLFCNRVFVTDNCKDLIPEYLMCLRGALDSTDIPLNVSRSALQMDRTVRQLSSHISKKIGDRLSSLYQTERDKFNAAWPDIELIIKLGILQDEKFYEKAKEFLIWKNLKGEWISLPTSEKIFYTTDPHAPALELYKDQEIIISSSPVDTHLFNFLEPKLSTKFQRIDGALDPAILDASREKTVLDADGKTESSRIADYIRSQLDTVDVEAKSLSSDSLPAFILVDESIRRMRDYLALSGQETFPAKKTFVVNTNSKLISSIYTLKDSNPALAQEMVRHLYDLSLLAQRELDPEALSAFVSRSNKVLENIVSSLST
jgi:molecular chaperone HtpG